MCKIIVYTKAPFADAPKKQRALFHRLLVEIAKTEHGGLGLAYLDAAGTIRRRRWATDADYKGLMADDYRGPMCEETSTPPGEIEAPAAGFVLLHGRTPTSEKGLYNAHPHVGEANGSKFALIHNGTVTANFADKAALGELLTGCDSELILAAFMAGGMARVSEIIHGSYAFAVMVVTLDGQKSLHVVRDDKTSLYCGEQPNHHGYVFATTADLITKAGVEEYARVCPLQHFTFDAEGELTGMDDIPAPQESWRTFEHGGSYGGVRYDNPPPLPVGAGAPHTMANPTPVTLASLPAAPVEYDRSGNPIHPSGDVTAHQLSMEEIIDLNQHYPLDELEEKINKADRMIDQLQDHLDPLGADYPEQERALARACGRHQKLIEIRRRRTNRLVMAAAAKERGVIEIDARTLSDEEARAAREAEKQAALDGHGGPTEEDAAAAGYLANQPVD